MRLHLKKSVLGWSALTVLALGLSGEARAQAIVVRRTYAPYYRPTTVVRQTVRTYVAPALRRPYFPPVYGPGVRSTTIVRKAYVAPRPYLY